MISRFSDAYSSKLIEKGSFSPCQFNDRSKRSIQFSVYKKGWLICWGMETFWGEAFGANGTAPEKSYFNIKNLNVDAWVNAAKECDIQYAGLTIVTEIGFDLWNSEIDFNLINKNGLTPTHPNYNLRGHADENILEKFVTKFRSAGIEPFFYYNLSLDWNILENMLGIGSTLSISDKRREDIVLFWALQCQELMLKYKIKMFWMDGFDRLTKAEYQKIYNAIKSIDKDCLVIMNATGDTSFDQYPYDIGSTETSFVDTGNEAFVSAKRTKDGVDYYIPQEIVISGTTSTSPQNWYNYDSLCISQPSNPNLVLVSQEYYQSIFDKAKTAGASLLCAVMPDRSGKLYKPQIDLIKNLI